MTFNTELTAQETPDTGPIHTMSKGMARVGTDRGKSVKVCRDTKAVIFIF